MGAAKISIADSGIDLDKVNKKRFGVLIGSGVGGLEAVEESCRRNSKPSARGRGGVVGTVVYKGRGGRGGRRRFCCAPTCGPAPHPFPLPPSPSRPPPPPPPEPRYY